MINEHVQRLLWVDDDIDHLGPFIDELRRESLEVSIANSSETALLAAQHTTFDIILVDILMPPPDGIELLRRLRPAQPHASLAALSSFLYLSRYRDQIRALGFPVELIDKDFPNIAAADFRERFIEPILNLATNGVTHTLEEQDRSMGAPVEGNPFDMRLSEFLGKPLVEKDRLTRLASEIASSTLDTAFSKENKIWILLCGSPTQIRQYAVTLDEVPSEDVVMEFARRQQRAPFQFFRPLQIDDMWSGDCGTDVSLRYYPTVTLEFRDYEEAVVVHFDTGAPMTFFSYEELVRVKAIRPTNAFTWAVRPGYKPYPMVLFNIEVVLCGNSGGPKAEVTLRGQAVRDWANAPYARFCNPGCEYFTKANVKQLCRYRKGLVGRNILIDNAIALILDGRVKKTILG